MWVAQDSVVNSLADEVSGRMLYAPVKYRASDGSWHDDFLEAVRHCDGPLTWDPGAVQSILSYGYACGDRTLVQQVTRMPWLSSLGPDGEPRLLDIPPHGRKAFAPRRIAEQLGRLLEDEIVLAAQGRKKIMLLLSGGLDSRIVAGVTARAARKGRISAEIVGVTWGIARCRDTVYGKAVAETLGFDWIHAELGPEHVIANIDLTARCIGGLCYPVHLHRMGWFENAGADTLALGGSYGDSVGRAEFSGKHLLEIAPLVPGSAAGLMAPAAQAAGTVAMKEDLAALRRRAEGDPRYVICELEMQGHYMRGLISQSMNVINRYCTLYQAFTHPDVYGYMWSIHPAMRTDEPYAELLSILGKDLAALPWARTNRALAGPTRGAVRNLPKDFHQYESWIGGQLYDRLRQELDIPWLSSTGLFEEASVANLLEAVGSRKPHRTRTHPLTWLLMFQKLGTLIEQQGVAASPPEIPADVPEVAKSSTSLRARLTKVPILVRAVRQARRWNRWRVRRRALAEFPPEQDP